MRLSVRRGISLIAAKERECDFMEQRKGFQGVVHQEALDIFMVQEDPCDN
jgi:hypothetical protein